MNVAFSAKQVAVVGLGKSGKGAIELLLSRRVKVTRSPHTFWTL